MKILSVIIPCYNEQETIGSIIEKVSGIGIPGWKLEIIVVDDGSRDGTRNILKKYESRIKVIYHAENKGKGSTVRTGLENASGDYLMIQDADLEYDPAEIPSLVDALEKGRGAVIYGSRNLHHDKRRRMLIPRLGTWVTTKEFNLLYGTHLTDLWTCYKLFPRDAADFYVSGGFESDLIFSARLARAGYTTAEVPISHKPRSVQEGKKIRYRDGIWGLWLLLRERFT